jgi:hypothetical protein
MRVPDEPEEEVWAFFHYEPGQLDEPPIEVRAERDQPESGHWPPPERKDTMKNKGLNCQTCGKEGLAAWVTHCPECGAQLQYTEHESDRRTR